MPPAPTRHGFRILVCPDAELLRRQVAQQAAPLGKSCARKVFWADDEPFPPAYWTELTIQNLFATPTVLVLRRAETLKAEAWDKIDEALPRATATVLPVLCLEGAWKDGKTPAVPNFLPKRRFWQTATERGWIWQSPGLTEAELPKFLDQWAAGAGLSLEPAARRALVEALPRDALSAGLELDKIALAADEDRTIRPEHAQLVAPHGDMEFFDFMRALAIAPRENPEAFREVWARVLDDKLRPSGDRILFQLLGYVSWQARQMWLLNEGEDAKVRMNPRDKPALTRTAKRLGRAGIARVIDLTLDAQLGVISGARRPDDTLEAYVAALAELLRSEAGPPAAGRRA